MKFTVIQSSDTNCILVDKTFIKNIPKMHAFYVIEKDITGVIRCLLRLSASYWMPKIESKLFLSCRELMTKQLLKLSRI